jgi:hypothetical protein
MKMCCVVLCFYFKDEHTYPSYALFQEAVSLTLALYFSINNLKKIDRVMLLRRLDKGKELRNEKYLAKLKALGLRDFAQGLSNTASNGV